MDKEKELFSLVNNCNKVSKNDIVMFIIKPPEFSSDKDNILLENIINVMLQDIDSIISQHILIPNKYSKAFEFYSDGKLPFFYIPEADVYGFCMHTFEIPEMFIKEKVKEFKKKFNYHCSLKFTWGYFKTFWNSYSTVNFFNCSDVLCKNNIGEQKLVYII